MRVSRLPVLPAAIATVAILLAGPVTALTVTEWGKALAAPRVAGPGFAGDGRALTFGHLELRTAGTIVPVVVAGPPEVSPAPIQGASFFWGAHPGVRFSLTPGYISSAPPGQTHTPCRPL